MEHAGRDPALRRPVHPVGGQYNYTRLTQMGPSTYAVSVVSTQQSDPTKDDLWFARTVDPTFPNATAFLGDYSNIAVAPATTHTVAYWTDMREQDCFGGRCASSEEAYFAYGP